jgi:hypothetical protein
MGYRTLAKILERLGVKGNGTILVLQNIVFHCDLALAE